MSKKYESKMDDDAVIYKADEFLDRIKLESNSKEVDVITTGTYGRRLAKKWRRPHLEIDFKEKNKIKPYIDIMYLKEYIDFFTLQMVAAVLETLPLREPDYLQVCAAHGKNRAPAVFPLP